MNDLVEIAAKRIHAEMVDDFHAALSKANVLLSPFTAVDARGVVSMFGRSAFSEEWKQSVEEKLAARAKEMAQAAFVDLILAQTNTPKRLGEGGGGFIGSTMLSP